MGRVGLTAVNGPPRTLSPPSYNQQQGNSGSNKDLLGINTRQRIQSRQNTTHRRKKHTANLESISNENKSYLINNLSTNGQSIHPTTDIPILPHIGSNGQQHTSGTTPTNGLLKRQLNGNSANNNSILLSSPMIMTQQQRDNSALYVEEHITASSTSIRGLKPGNPNWINQDNFFVIDNTNLNSNRNGNSNSHNHSSSNVNSNSNESHYYCILDGHGENGHHVSRKCRENLPIYLKQVNGDTKRSFLLMQNDLSICDFDTRCSGATCVLMSWKDNLLTVSNAGDSRAVLGRRNNSNNSITSIALSNDHKPDKPEERKRILAQGGHLGCRQVLVHQPGKGPVSMPVGPCRG